MLKATKNTNKQSKVSFAAIHDELNTEKEIFAGVVMKKSFIFDDRVVVFEEKSYLNGFQENYIYI